MNSSKIIGVNLHPGKILVFGRTLDFFLQKSDIGFESIIADVM